jgi:hypothetical protein
LNITINLTATGSPQKIVAEIHNMQDARLLRGVLEPNTEPLARLGQQPDSDGPALLFNGKVEVNGIDPTK